MRLPDELMKLKRGDDGGIVTSAVDGTLLVYRTVELRVCRCRECNDTCEWLAERPHTLCVTCHNNHSQKADPNNSFSEWLGPLVGPRRPLTST